jgi:hypothetical protein
MQCVDCHFAQDAHGNGHIYGEVAAAIESRLPRLPRHGERLPDPLHLRPGRDSGGRDMKLLRTQDGRRRFEWREGKLYPAIGGRPDLEWEMSSGEGHGESRAPELQPEGGPGQDHEHRPHPGLGRRGGPAELRPLRRQDDLLLLPPSWTTSCAGCHLPVEANWKTERNHYEGWRDPQLRHLQPAGRARRRLPARQTRRVKGNRIAPVRSSSALVLSSTNINRERIYMQQPPISASGYSSQAFAPHYPHTERKTETKTCTDCHVSAQGDNNAIMAQLLLQGTNFLNFVGLQRLGRLDRSRRGDAGHRVGGTAGGHRQLPPALRLSGLVCSAPEAEARLTEDTHPRHGRTGDVRAVARRVPVRGRGQRGIPGVRRGLDRQQGRGAAHHHRAVLAARQKTTCLRPTPPAWPCPPISPWLPTATRAT